MRPISDPEVWLRIIIDLYFAARKKKLHLPWMEFVEDYLRDSVDDHLVVRFKRHAPDFARDGKTATHTNDP